MAKDIQSQLQSRIDAFTADLTKLLAQAAQEAVADALKGQRRASPARGKKTAKKASKRGKRAAGPANSDLDEKLYREIKRKAGRRLEELADAMGVNSKSLKFPARRLVEQKRVKKSGQARGTKYRAA